MKPYWVPTQEEIAIACRRIKRRNGLAMAASSNGHEFTRCGEMSEIAPLPMWRPGWKTLGSGRYWKQPKKGKD